MAGQQLWVRNGETVSGPFASAQIRELVQRGKVARETLLSKDKTMWVRADSVRGLEFVDRRTSPEASDESVAIPNVDREDSEGNEEVGLSDMADRAAQVARLILIAIIHAMLLAVVIWLVQLGRAQPINEYWDRTSRSDAEFLELTDEVIFFGLAGVAALIWVVALVVSVGPSLDRLLSILESSMVPPGRRRGRMSQSSDTNATITANFGCYSHQGETEYTGNMRIDKHVYNLTAIQYRQPTSGSAARTLQCEFCGDSFHVLVHSHANAWFRRVRYPVFFTFCASIALWYILSHFHGESRTAALGVLALACFYTLGPSLMHVHNYAYHALQIFSDGESHKLFSPPPAPLPVSPIAEAIPARR